MTPFLSILRLSLALVVASATCGGCKPPTPPPPAGLAAMQRRTIDIDQLSPAIANLAFLQMTKPSAESREALLRSIDMEVKDLRLTDPSFQPPNGWEFDVYVRQASERTMYVVAAINMVRKDCERRLSAHDPTAAGDLDRLRALVRRLAEVNPDLFVPPSNPTPPTPPATIDVAAELAPPDAEHRKAQMQGAIDITRRGFRRVAESLQIELPPAANPG